MENIDSLRLDQDYFFWGCGEPVQYGLYSPVADRIVLVSDNADVLEHLVFLMSSKIRLLIAPLHTSPDFKLDLIDNTCCTGWSVINWPKNSLDQKFDVPVTRKNFVVEHCGNLVEKPVKDLTDVQNFAFLAFYVIKFFKFSDNCQYTIFSNLVELPFPDFDRVKELECNCYKAIYLSADYKATKESIRGLCRLAQELL